MKYFFVIIIVMGLVLTGCSNSLTGSVIDENGCSKQENWCSSLDKCIDFWNSYCPLEGESIKLITVNDCNRKEGIPVNHGGGDKCPEGTNVQGEVVGLLSLHVCCIPY